jgi:hypothetical protein
MSNQKENKSLPPLSFEEFELKFYRFVGSPEYIQQEKKTIERRISSSIIDDKKESQWLSELNLEKMKGDTWDCWNELEAFIRKRKVKELPVNSWEYVNQLRDEMIEDSDKQDSLEPAWELLQELYGDLFKRFSNKVSFKTPIEEFMYCVSSGFYPRPELLVAVNDAFQSYFSKGGSVELEEVFFGKRAKRIGNYSSLITQHPDLDMLETLLSRSNSPLSKKHGVKPLTLNKAADIVIDRLSLDIDPESLLRKYRRYRDGK